MRKDCLEKLLKMWRDLKMTAVTLTILQNLQVELVCLHLKAYTTASCCEHLFKRVTPICSHFPCLGKIRMVTLYFMNIPNLHIQVLVMKKKWNYFSFKFKQVLFRVSVCRDVSALQKQTHIPFKFYINSQANNSQILNQ